MNHCSMKKDTMQHEVIKKGLLIYNPEDYEKNKWFVSELVTKAAHHGLSLKLILRHELVLSIEENTGLTAFHLTYQSSPIPTSSLDSITIKEASSSHKKLSPKEASDASSALVPLTDIDFVINRTRDSLIGTHFEKMG